MAYTLRISPQAHNDIVAIYNYILKDGESIAKKQVSEIYSALLNLAQFPNIGKKLAGYVSKPVGYRFIIINKLYLAFYNLSGNFVDVIRILRGEQDYITLLGLN